MRYCHFLLQFPQTPLKLSTHISFGRSNQEERDGRGMWHELGTGEVHTGFWWGDLRERDQLKDLGVDGRILKCMFEKRDGEAWIGLLWLSRGKGGGCL